MIHTNSTANATRQSGLLRQGLLALLCMGTPALSMAHDTKAPQGIQYTGTKVTMTEANTAPTAIKLFAAGSLKVALGEIAQAWAEHSGQSIETEFAPSGLLRERIESGEVTHVFASANLRHPEILQAAGHSESVVLFARNQLCALSAPELNIDSDALLDAMLDDALRLGTSTPRADPSGDYAFSLFAKAEHLRPGAQQALEAKALQLTGGPESAAPPKGRNTYAWVIDSDQADIFLTYCTNAVLAKREVPELNIVQIPDALSVGADYGLSVLTGAPPEAWQLAMYILSPDGQSRLADYGFSAVALPR